MGETRRGERPLELGLLLLANLVGGSSAIMIKASTLHPILQASYRLLLGGLILSPLFVRELRREGRRLSVSLVAPAVLPGIVLGLHFITWIAGARMTFAGNATVIVTMVPVALPVFVFLTSRELPARSELVGTLVAVAGIAILATFDFRLERSHFGGDLVCFLSMVLYAFYLSLAKRRAPAEGIMTYLVPLYLCGGVFCFLASLPFASPFAGITVMDVLMTLGLALGPTVIGHSLMNRAMTRLPPQTVSLFNLVQFVVAGVLAYFIFGERPGTGFAFASPLIAIGVAVPILAKDVGRRAG